MQNRSAGLRAIAVKATLLVCALLLLPATGMAAGEAPYELYAVLGLTGAATFVGQAQYQTLEALETLVNAQGGIRGRKIHITMLDNASDPKVAIQLTTSVLAKKVPVIFVSGQTAVCRAVAVLVNDGPVEYCFSPALYPAKDSYVFSGSASTDAQIVAMLRFFVSHGWQRLAEISNIDASGLDSVARLDAILSQPEFKGLSIVQRERADANDLSVSAQLANIEAAKPQVLIVWSAGSAFGTVLRGLHDSGSVLPVFTLNANLVYKEMKQYAAFLPPALYISGPGFVVNQSTTSRGRLLQRQFAEAIRQGGGVPDYVGGNAWDPVLLVVDALRHLGLDASATQLRDYLLHIRDTPGISGTYNFTTGDQRGLNEKDVIIMRWDQSKDWWTAVSQAGGAPLR